MAMPFRQSMQNVLLPILREAYNAETAIIVPGSGTFAMYFSPYTKDELTARPHREAVARQFALNQKTVIVRNGLFSFRWSAILEMAGTTVPPTVLRAAPLNAADPQSQWAPPAIATVVQTIREQRPRVVFVPHVETATGILLPEDYLAQIGQACRDADALFCLDCIASGALWTDMKRFNVDIVISAPQKAWSSSACCGFVMLGARGREALKASGPASSFALDLKQWDLVWTEKYAKGEFLCAFFCICDCARPAGGVERTKRSTN